MAKGLNMSSAAIALLGLLAVKGFQHREELGRMVGDVMGNRDTATGDGGIRGSVPGSGGGLGDMLGSILGGGAGAASTGGVLRDGLGGLLDRFKQTGHAEEAESWVHDGPNREVDPRDLEDALGEDVIGQLQAQTGLDRQELLRRLSTNLPKTVDTLTPEGRVPTPDEIDQFAPSSRFNQV